MFVEVKNHLPLNLGAKDTIEGDSIVEYPAASGPWAVNPCGARVGSGRMFNIAWKDKAGKIRSGKICS